MRGTVGRHDYGTADSYVKHIALFSCHLRGGGMSPRAETVSELDLDRQSIVDTSTNVVAC